MKVEILEERLRDAGYNLSRGDMITVDDELGANWCSNGWAKDTSGEVATGERNLNPVTVNPKSAVHVTKSPEVGGVKKTRRR